MPSKDVKDALAMVRQTERERELGIKSPGLVLCVCVLQCVCRSVCVAVCVLQCVYRVAVCVSQCVCCRVCVAVRVSSCMNVYPTHSVCVAVCVLQCVCCSVCITVCVLQCVLCVCYSACIQLHECVSNPSRCITYLKYLSLS